MAGRFFLRFCLLFLSRHLPPPRYRRKRKSAEINSAQIRKKELCKSRQDDTAGKSSRERQAPALYAAVRVRRRPYGVSCIPRSVAGRITGHRRSLPQPSSAVWCPRLLTRAEVKPSIPQRTDPAQVKRDRHTGKPRKARNTKSFRLRQFISFAEIRRKQPSLPTGEVRPSEHNSEYKELSLYDHERYLPHSRYPVGQAGAA